MQLNLIETDKQLTTEPTYTYIISLCQQIIAPIAIPGVAMGAVRIALYPIPCFIMHIYSSSPFIKA